MVVIDTLSQHGEFLSVKEEVMDDGGHEEETSDGDSSFGNMADGNHNSVLNASNNVVDFTLGSGDTSSTYPTDDSNEDWRRFGGIRLMQRNILNSQGGQIKRSGYKLCPKVAEETISIYKGIVANLFAKQTT